MRSTLNFYFVSFLIFACCANLAAQKKDRVEAREKLIVESIGKICANLKPGRIVVLPKPVYPDEARTARAGGTIRATVKIGESGNVAEIERIQGTRILQTAAADAARKAKYKPTVCDGAATVVTAVFTYDFIPFLSTGRYFTPTKTQDFADIKSDSPHYETVLSLTENYRLAFGYDNKKFYADAPLTRGDFAQFLRLTLDLLAERATAAGKLPREINLFYSYNPQKLTVVSGIKDFKAKDAFAESVKTLLLKYDVAPVNEQKEFQGNFPLTNNEVIDYWSKIFGDEAIPVNFERIADGDRLISRGEFALFLLESLQVLTYKVLPD